VVLPISLLSVILITQFLTLTINFDVVRFDNFWKATLARAASFGIHPLILHFILS